MAFNKPSYASVTEGPLGKVDISLYRQNKLREFIPPSVRNGLKKEPIKVILQIYAWLPEHATGESYHV